MSWQVLRGDCAELMAALEPNSVDAVVCDPPYGLEFMGHEWDSFRTGRSANYAAGGELAQNGDSAYPGASGPVYVKRPARRCKVCGKQEWSGSPCECDVPEWDSDPSPLWAFQAWCENWAREALRVVKPGGYLLAFGGQRTWHRLVSGIEDAGWEVRDCLLWLFGQGFPKGGYVEGAPGWATTLKPAYEPIAMARKPPIKSVASNMERFGTGGLNVDGCRVEGIMDGSWGGSNVNTEPGYGGGFGKEYRTAQHEAGRWPANVLCDEVAGELIDAEAGERGGGFGVRGAGGEVYGDNRTFQGDGRTVGYGDRGGPSRFFYSPKATGAERDSGLPAGEENLHPTVKPVDLMRWLCRLVTGPGGTVLDPFAGSGTTGCGAVAEGFSFVGCEREPAYADVAEKRIAWWAEHEGIATEKAIASAAGEREREGAGQLGLGL